MPSDAELKASAKKGYLDAIRLAIQAASNAPMGPEVKVS
jgi:hypothetical protein